MRLVLLLKALIQRLWLRSDKRSAYSTTGYELSSPASRLKFRVPSAGYRANMASSMPRPGWKRQPRKILW